MPTNFTWSISKMDPKSSLGLGCIKMALGVLGHRLPPTWTKSTGIVSLCLNLGLMKIGWSARWNAFVLGEVRSDSEGAIKYLHERVVLDYILFSDNFSKVRNKLKPAEDESSTDLNTPLDEEKIKRKRLRKRRRVSRYSPSNSCNEGNLSRITRDQCSDSEHEPSLQQMTNLKCPPVPASLSSGLNKRLLTCEYSFNIFAHSPVKVKALTSIFFCWQL